MDTLVSAKKKPVKNVFTKMEDYGNKGGPLGVLHKYIVEQRKIKVSIRNAIGIRSFCTGYIIAFDFHWNMAMVDVDEIFIISNNDNKGTHSSLEFEDITKYSKNSNTRYISRMNTSAPDYLKWLKFSSGNLKIINLDITPKHLDQSEDLKCSTSFSKCMNKPINLYSSDIYNNNETDTDIIQKPMAYSSYSTANNTRNISKELNFKITNERTTTLAKNADRNRTTLTRHINQLFIRGDNVVIVSALSYT